jgi:hypothetical protein
MTFHGSITVLALSFVYRIQIPSAELTNVRVTMLLLYQYRTECKISGEM